jgi:hypothetical protein
MRFLRSLFKKRLGRIADPMKNAMNPISNVTTKLLEGGFKDSIKKSENKNRTIKGLNI